MYTVLSKTFEQALAERIKADTWFTFKGFFTNRGVGGPDSLGIFLEDADGDFTVYLQPTSSSRSHFNIVDEDWDSYKILGKHLKSIEVDCLLENVIKLLKQLSRVLA